MCVAFWYGSVLGGYKLVCFGSWQAVLLSWLVLLVGVKSSFTLGVILVLLVPVLGVCVVFPMFTSGVKIV